MIRAQRGKGVAGGPTRYFGQGFSPRGEKDRFVLPADFRASVRAASGGDKLLCLDAHHKLPCLVGYGFDRTETFDTLVHEEWEMAKAAHDATFDRDERLGQLAAFHSASFDDSGRFVLPGYLAEMAEVSDGLYFNGGSEMITIWAPEKLFAMGPGWNAAKAKCRALMAEAASGSRRGGRR
ncbi:MAG: division/cell wall cluster transcriptional repressor MraZ [Sphingomonadales bacterium]|nr:division/cell wall cluster transcriptional repressor MraZ [Sphingomonadales bacterium]MDE2567586.1 division/cell wall cluster transcriptional repressor MraZ [Sphingomonadales bacterium]